MISSELHFVPCHISVFKFNTAFHSPTHSSAHPQASMFPGVIPDGQRRGGHDTPLHPGTPPGPHRHCVLLHFSDHCSPTLYVFPLTVHTGSSASEGTKESFIWVRMPTAGWKITITITRPGGLTGITGQWFTLFVRGNYHWSTFKVYKFSVRWHFKIEHPRSAGLS